MTYIITFLYIPILDDLPNLYEVKAAINCIHRGTGIDGLPPSVLKILPNSMLNCLLLLIQKVFTVSYPEDWNKQILHTLTKKDHSYHKPDLRGIGIAPLICRIYDNIIESRIRSWYIPNHQQAGFRKGQGCLFQIFILTLLIYFSKENDKNLFVAFMDYQKAFDFANRRNIISDVMKKGCGSQLTKAIANMYMVTEYLPKLKWNK